MKNQDYRLHTQRKNNQSLSSVSSSTPVPGIFESRPFVVQQKQRDTNNRTDLKEKLMRAERYGHHLSGSSTEMLDPGKPIQGMKKKNQNNVGGSAGTHDETEESNNVLKPTPLKPTPLMSEENKETDGLQTLLTRNFWLDQYKKDNPPDEKDKRKGETPFGNLQSKGVALPKKQENNKKRTNKEVIELVKKMQPHLEESKKQEEREQLKIYRTMDKQEFEKTQEWYGTELQRNNGESMKQITENAILSGHENNHIDEDGIMPIRGHLGDRAQAESYAKSQENQHVLEYVMKKGAEQFLFHPEIMAIATPNKNQNWKGAAGAMATHFQKTIGQAPAVATGNEGNLPGYIGMKPEGDKRSEGFSLNIGKNKPSALLFQMLVDQVNDHTQTTRERIQQEKGMPKTPEMLNK